MNCAKKGQSNLQPRQIYGGFKVRSARVPSSRTPQAAKPLKPDAASLKQTIHLAQQGDASAFEIIYEMHSRRVYSLCLRMTGDPMRRKT